MLYDYRCVIGRVHYVRGSLVKWEIPVGSGNCGFVLVFADFEMGSGNMLKRAITDKAANSIRILSSEDGAIWDALVDASPTANRFLRSDCLRMLEQTDSVGIQFLQLGAFDHAGNLCAGWALPSERQYGINTSTYFEFFYAGPILSPDLVGESIRVRRARMQVLHDLAQAGAGMLDIISCEGHPGLHDVRGICYAGWQAQIRYAHVWDFTNPTEILAQMNREHRRLIKRGCESYTFGALGPDHFQTFIALHKDTLVRRFRWKSASAWDTDLARRMEWLLANDVGCLYGARNAAGDLCAAVVLLYSCQDRTAYLWRSGNIAFAGTKTIVPSLYWQACLYARERWGTPLCINFGGSPQMSLSQFKDYLGARPEPHFRFIYRTSHWRSALWLSNRILRKLNSNQLGAG